MDLRDGTLPRLNLSTYGQVTYGEMKVMPSYASSKSADKIEEAKIEYWSCSKTGIWRSPILIAWYVTVVLFAIYLVYQHYGSSGALQRHESTKIMQEYLAAHEVPAEVRTLHKHAGVYAGFTNEEQFGEISIKPNSQADNIYEYNSDGYD